MTTAANAAPKSTFKPIFAATITPGASIEEKTSATGTAYIKMTGATVARGDKPAQERTVMAFGKSADAVRDMLVEGQPVELAVQYDGGSVKIIGEVREDQAAEG
ncbi:hypothetical protein [Erythrobacter aureus]|uniref:Copper-binding protein n=1 Tax=Erythrobacter aureus TaxID=2182384 RepID=A0A345YJ06_9SPHN|nr:hypothetical protein [Erythrobacter aureus]AXK43908.1 hypothetical protein DVR09_15755 [Erythrobacter aureus]